MQKTRLATFLSGVLLSAGTFVGAERLAGSEDGVVRCRQLVLEDRKGVERGWFGLESDGAAVFRLVDSDGEKLVEVRADDVADSTHGMTSISIFGSNSYPRLVLSNLWNQHGNFNAIRFRAGEEEDNFRVEETTGYPRGVTLGLGASATGTVGIAVGTRDPGGPDDEDLPPFAEIRVKGGDDRLDLLLGEEFQGINSGGPLLRRIQAGELVDTYRFED